MNQARQRSLPHDETSSPAVGSPPPAVGPPPLRSADLFAGTREVLIQHGEDTYRLKLTGNNKLILTK